MAYPFVTVCILIFLFYPVTSSQESPQRKPVSTHLRHSRHSQDVAQEDGHGYEDEAGEEYNSDMDQEKERIEKHSSQQQLENQGNSVLIPEKNSSREADGFDRTSPKDIQQRPGLSKAPVHQQSPFFSKVLSAAGSASQKTKKKRHQKFSRKRSSKKQVNRPRWYFRLGYEHNDAEGEQKIAPQSKGSKGVHKNGKEEGEGVEAGEEEGEDSRRRGMAREAVAGTGRRKARGQRKRPVVKECVECTETEAKIAESRELHKRILVAQLLDKLRLEPTLTERPLPPKLPDQVFPEEPLQDHPGYQEDQYYAKPTQLLVFGQDLGKHRLRKPRTGSYTFELRNKVQGEVTNADLWVYKMPDAHDSHGQTLVVTQLHHSKGRRLRERSLVARLDTHVQEGWVRFDVTQLVRSWLEDDDMTSSSSHMLAIRCKTCHRTSYRAIFGVKSNFRPVLVMTEHRHPPEHSPRDKRNSQCDPTSGCCKFDLTVRFHDLGIHEIFYPKTIRTGYCFGTCERPDLHYHNHTMIMQRLRYGSYSPVDEALRDRLRPCCVPVVLREASVMHYINDGQDTQVSLIPNLLVDKCGCA